MTLSKRNDSTIRQYRPKVGQLIAMSEFSDYTSRGLSPWGRLRVIGIDKDLVTVKHAPNPMDPTCDDPSQLTIPLYVVQFPCGWEPRYTIHCKPEQADKIINDWFKRGIVVRQSHDMSGSMPTAFQPLNDGVIPGPSHWQFVEDTDVVPAEDCAKLFRVVAVQEEEITSATLGFPPDQNCNLCQGTGRRSIAHLADARKEPLEKTRAMIVSHEDYGKLDHAEQEKRIPLDDYNTDSDTFRCHCAQHGAMGRMGRTKRAKLIKQMAADGWKVEYRPYAGGYWERRKETVVHDWQEGSNG